MNNTISKEITDYFIPKINDILLPEAINQICMSIQSNKYKLQKIEEDFINQNAQKTVIMLTFFKYRC